MRLVSIRILFVCGLLVAHTGRIQTVAVAQSPTGNKAQSATVPAPTGDPLLRLLVSKGLLTTEEAGMVLSSETPAQRLAILLKDKGLISIADFDALQVSAAPDGHPLNVNAMSSGSNASTGRAPSASSQKPAPSPSVHRCRCADS